MKFTFAGFVLNTETHVLSRNGVAQAVEPQVFDLLCLLAREAGKLVTKDQMIEEIWGGRIVAEATIDGRIAAARKVVGDDGRKQAVIATVIRRGIRLVVPVEVSSCLDTAIATASGDKDAVSDPPPKNGHHVGDFDIGGDRSLGGQSSHPYADAGGFAAQDRERGPG